MKIEREYGANRQMFINLTAQLISFVVSMGIGFVLTPFIVNNVGKEAYGFVGLANNFVSYAQIIMVALNSMASRYITIFIHKKDIKNANIYFTSVFIANIVMSLILFVPSIFIVIFMNRIFNVPSNVLRDVQTLWIFIFLNFLISIIGSTFSIATFVRNKLYLDSVKSIQANILRVVCLLGCFLLLKPSVWYIGLASLVMTMFIVTWDVYYTKKLLSEVNIHKKYFSINAVKELLSQGIWNSLTKLSQVLLDGLDLLIANLLIGSAEMGVLSIAKIIPTIISSIMGTIVNVFNPQLTIEYAHHNKDGILSTIKSSNKILTYLMSIPLAAVIVYGDKFYALWVPKEDTILLQRLSVLTMAVMIVSANIQVLYHVFVLTKNVKANSIVMLLNGLASTIVVFILLKYTSLGLYAIAGTSTVLGLIRNLLFTPIYAAKCLKVKWNTFYSSIGLGMVDIAIVIVAGYIIRQFISINSWITLIFSGIIWALLALILNFFIILRKEERNIIVRKFKSVF